MQMSHVEMKGY